MSDTYGVTPADVSNELPGLYRDGFTQVSRPSLAQVVSLITTADTIVTLAVVDATGTVPDASDRAAPLARRYVIEWVKGQVIRAVMTGNDPQSVAASVAPYDVVIAQLSQAIQRMGSQAVGSGASAPRVGVAYVLPDRDLVVTDDMLGLGSAGRRRVF